MTPLTYAMAIQLEEPCRLLVVADTAALTPGAGDRVHVPAGTVLSLRGYPGGIARGVAQVRVVRRARDEHQLLCCCVGRRSRGGRWPGLWMPLESVEVLR